ncbi:MAG: lysylphosphatidylglycerol synthase transmembrane domain-containing protein [Bacteroidales bacterium]|nr:lysylphosphatidylglycerol synthase transmembrane domain-containing protein [Bacteroidales bacterium]
MDGRLKKGIRITVFFAIGALLFWLAYRGQDIGTLINALEGTRWGWIVAIATFYLTAHYSRAERWRLLLEPFGYKPRGINLFMSVLVMYLSNLAIPRSGEVLRCGIVSKYEKIPFARCLGTVVTERIADLTIILIVSAIVLASQWGFVSEMVAANPDISERIELIKQYIIPISLILIVLTIVGIWLFRLAIRRNIFGIGDKINGIWQQFRDGLTTILHLKHRTLFIIHSLYINFVYFYAVYIGFKAFGFTEHLTLITGLMVFVLATFGVIIPSPGGMGTWHFIVIETLAMYGVKRDPDGRAFALVIHGLQDISFIILGALSLILLPVINKDYVPQVDDADQTPPNT